MPKKSTYGDPAAIAGKGTYFNIDDLPENPPRGNDDANKKNEYKKETKLQAEVIAPRFVAKLRAADIAFLIATDIGKNILNELGIGPFNEQHKLDPLTAGTLAFSFGMLSLRNKYMEDNTSKLETPRYPDLGEDASHRRSAKLDFEAVKKLDKQIALDLILRNPDMTLKEKQDMIQAISNDRDDLDLVYDRRKQSELTGDIKKEADIFYKQMIRNGWVNIPPGFGNELPDQFLAAVGDGSTSSGIGKSPDPYGMGLGYFRYSNEGLTDPTTRSLRSLYSNEKLTSEVPLFPIQNTVNFMFPVDVTAPLIIKLSAYGFDPKGGGTPDEAFKNKSALMNGLPTRVLVYQDGVVIDGYQCTLDINNGYKPLIQRIQGVHVSPGVSELAPGVIKIPANFRIGGPVKCVVFNVPVPHNNIGDRDEIQVQFSTNGTIHDPDPVLAPVKLPILFKKDSDEFLDPVDAGEKLDPLIRQLKSSRDRNASIYITGYTSIEGDHDHNVDLSKRRAKAVSDYITRQPNGIDPARVHFNGLGPTTDFGDHNISDMAESNLILNRRVEYRLVR